MKKMADLEKTAKIEDEQKEVTFEAHIYAGKYDLEAQLIDEDNRIHPSYYLYIGNGQLKAR